MHFAGAQKNYFKVYKKEETYHLKKMQSAGSTNLQRVALRLTAQQNEVEEPGATPFPLQQATLTQQGSAFMALLLTLQ